MIRRSIVLLSLCCVVLCAFVGYLSHKSIQEANKRIGPPVRITCDDLLTATLNETARFEVDTFVPGKFVASINSGIDQEWGTVCLPLFPNDRELSLNGYQAVLVCFRGVPDRESLDPLIRSGEIDLHYWPQRQQLDPQIHSQLARQYKNMDLVNCPILHFGYRAANPVLGDTSMRISRAIGTCSVAVFLVSLVWCLIRRLLPAKQKSDTLDGETDGVEKPGILDGVVTMRDKNRGSAVRSRSPAR